jgi:branched-chain amino acid transport system permease protein
MLGMVLVSALSLGAIYALVALGIVIVYKGTGIVNFAHGAIFTAGATLAYALVSAGILYSLSLFLALVLMVAFILIVERVALRPLVATADPLLFKGATIALAFFLVGMVRWFISRDGDYVSLEPILGYQVFNVFGLRVPSQDFFIIAATAVILLGFTVFFTRTRYGRLMQAVAENQRAAQVIGINVNHVYWVIWGVAGALGAVAGILMAPITLIHPDMGVLIFIKAIAAAILGGFDKLHGAVIGGLLVGFLEVIFSFYVGTIYQEAIPFFIILIVLLVRPQGLFGSKAVMRV